jgi:tRNA-dihydrouridine synthase C
MRLILAPMEGVVDHYMRTLLTEIGGFDRCVTEFIRVTQQTLPKRVFYRHCPELKQGGKTPAGTPVYVQLLGGNPDLMASNAQVAAQLGSPGIDINFGCPSKTVNNHDGGSALLREPKRIHTIVKACRDAVDTSIPVTTKIRLGYEDASLFEDIVAGIVDAGATELCIHARTRRDGYKPPAHWHYIKRIKDHAPIPIIANGEIWSAEDALKAQQESACEDLMLGRGSIAMLDLARSIKAKQQGEDYQPLEWEDVLNIILKQMHILLEEQPEKYIESRLKQWLTYLKRRYPEADQLFQDIKRMHDASSIMHHLSKISAQHVST